MRKFECRRCGNCCRWSGCVKLESHRVDVIAAFLGIPVEEFLERYTRLMPDRQGLSLTEKPDGSCVFLDGEEGEPARCRIQPVKPEQCDRFPLHWNFPGWEALCPGAPSQTEKPAES